MESCEKKRIVTVTSGVFTCRAALQRRREVVAITLLGVIDPPSSPSVFLAKAQLRPRRRWHRAAGYVSATEKREISLFSPVWVTRIIRHSEERRRPLRGEKSLPVHRPRRSHLPTSSLIIGAVINLYRVTYSLTRHTKLRKSRVTGRGKLHLEHCARHAT